MAAQAGLVVSFAIMAFISDPARNLLWMFATGFLVNFFASFQDAAVDGLAIEVLPQEQQGRANGFMLGGKTVGTAAASAGGSLILNSFGFGLAALLASAGLGLISLFPLLLRERADERLLPWTRGRATEGSLRLQLTTWRAILRSLLRVVWLPASRLAVLGFVAFSFGNGMLNAMLPVLAVGELNWANTDYSQLMAASRLVAGMVGMIIGATVVDRLGRVRCIILAAALLLLFEITMGALPHCWPIRTTLVVFVLMSFCCGNPFRNRNYCGMEDVSVHTPESNEGAGWWARCDLTA